MNGHKIYPRFFLGLLTSGYLIGALIYLAQDTPTHRDSGLLSPPPAVPNPMAPKPDLPPVKSPPNIGQQSKTTEQQSKPKHALHKDLCTGKTAFEGVICRSSALTELDKQVTDLSSSLALQSTGQIRADIEAGQRIWRFNRFKACQTQTGSNDDDLEDCVRKTLQARLSALSDLTTNEKAPTAVSSPHADPPPTRPIVLKKVDPQYSEEARKAKVAGDVLLSVVIGIDGKAHAITVTKSLGMGLDEKAIEAVQQWTFRPATRDGQPVPVSATIEVTFRLI